MSAEESSPCSPNEERAVEKGRFRASSAASAFGLICTKKFSVSSIRENSGAFVVKKFAPNKLARRHYGVIQMQKAAKPEPNIALFSALLRLVTANNAFEQVYAKILRLGPGRPRGEKGAAQLLRLCCL